MFPPGRTRRDGRSRAMTMPTPGDTFAGAMPLGRGVVGVGPGQVGTNNPGPQAESVYLTANQVGIMLQVSSKTVYRWLKEDPSMPALKLGGSIRFHRERLLRWLQEREQ